MKTYNLSAIVLSIVLSIVISQTTHAKSPPTNEYQLGPKDVISITIIAGGEEQAKTDLVISNQGEINVPFIGIIKAAGQTLSSLEKRIYIPLEQDYFVDPQINVQIKEYHSLSYTISGAVNKPGKYELDFHPTIMDLIAKAEGVLPERGNIAYILRELKRNDSQPIKINLTKLLDNGDMTQNIFLETGDKIYIPLEKKLDQSQTKVYIEGEIKRPGMIDYRPGLTALSACIVAGGFDKYAAPSRAKIIRVNGDKHEIIKINLDKVKDGDLPDIPLKPGDRIHIPETWL